MKKIINVQMILLLVAILGVSAIVGCSPPSPGADSTAPTVVSTYPADTATSVAITDPATATFSEEMDPATIDGASFLLAAGGTPVTGTVVYDLPSKTATFAPASNLDFDTAYTATITTGEKDLAGNALAADKVWTFTTAPVGVGPLPVRLGTAGNYVILSKSGISTVPPSAITGDIGTSPIATTAITGFSLIPETVTAGVTVFATSAQVTGFVYGADMAPPTSSNLTTAVLDMGAAYTDAAGRSDPPAILNLDGGNLLEQTLAPGLYNWGTEVYIATSITIDGGANDVWIFQISGGLTLANAAQVILSGGAQAKNIFWQVADVVALGTTSHFEGIILCQTAITLATNATMNGRALAGTEVTLDMSTVTKPAH
jgi:hypothetical protein